MHTILVQERVHPQILWRYGTWLLPRLHEGRGHFLVCQLPRKGQAKAQIPLWSLPNRIPVRNGGWFILWWLQEHSRCCLHRLRPRPRHHHWKLLGGFKMWEIPPSPYGRRRKEMIIINRQGSIENAVKIMFWECKHASIFYLNIKNASHLENL